MTRLILASGSPRRTETMKKITDDFEIVVPEIDETPLKDEKPDELVQRLALEKASRVYNDSKKALPVIGADTIVYLDEIIGKPSDHAEAASMLLNLSGRKHCVMTGVAILIPWKDDPVVFIEKTDVVFNPISAEEIEDYVQSGEPLGKAGAYAIQGTGGRFVRRIDGCFYNVMGFPLSGIYSRLLEYDVI